MLKKYRVTAKAGTRIDGNLVEKGDELSLNAKVAEYYLTMGHLEDVATVRGGKGLPNIEPPTKASKVK